MFKSLRIFQVVGGFSACLFACQVDLRVPPNTVIACDSRSDCPGEMVCHPLIKRCVSSADPGEPPAVLDAVLEPTVGTKGSVFSLGFSVNSELAVEPEVSVATGQTGGALVRFVLDEAASTREHFVYRYVATGLEPEGSFDLTISVIDSAGNQNSAPAGRITFDFSPPLLSTPAWRLPMGKSAASAAESVSFVARTESSAQLVTMAIINRTGERLLDVEVTRAVDPLTPGLVDLAGLVDTSRVSTDEIAIDVEVVDLAGNRAHATSAWLTIDSAAPANPSLRIQGKPVASSLSSRLELFAEFATEVFISGDVVLSANTFAWIPLLSTADVTLTPGDGNKTIEAKFRDGAWNESAIVSDTIALATGAVLSQPSLVIPSGQSQIKNGDLLIIEGIGEGGSTVVSARLVNVMSGATVQLLPMGDANVDLLGNINGAFRASGLTTGTTVALEVILRARNSDSIASQSRSLAVVVDDTPPSSASVTKQGAAATATTGVSVSVNAIGAVFVRLDGDVADGPNVRSWIPLTSPLSLDLATGDGDKVIVARFRDEAFNEAQATTSIRLDTALPTSAPILTGPWGISQVKNADPVAVSGSATALTAINVLSATVLSIDAAGAVLTGPGCQSDVTAQVQINNGVFSGLINVGAPCPSGTRVALRVVVQNAAGTSSSPALSMSNELTFDNAAPSPATAAQIVGGDTLSGYTSSVATVLALNATDETAVQVLIVGDVVANPATRVGTWVDFPGSEAVAGEEPILLSGGDGPKSISVKFRDAVRNETAPIAVAVTLDTIPPPAPQANALALVESSASPTNVATVDDSNNTFTLSGNAGAVINASRVEVYASSGPTGLITQPAQTVAVNGSFAATSVGYNASGDYYVVALDAAGNRSLATLINTPKVMAFSLPSTPRRAGVGFTASFDGPAASGTPVMSFAGHNATFTGQVSCGAGCVRYSYTYTPVAPSDPEGVNQCVVRVVTSDGRGLFASGTQGTDATTTTFDFTGPSVATGSIVLSENDPGTADVISGSAGSVSDNISPTTPAGTLTIVATDGVPLAACNPCNVAADGGFGPISLGDNLHSNVVLSFRDQAGNATTRTIQNDRTAPIISGLTASPAIQGLSGSVAVTFTVNDAHDLRTLPVVSVGGKSAAWFSGTVGTSDLTSHAFEYRVTVQPGDSSGAVFAIVRATDTAGNVSVDQTSVTIDSLPPVSSLILPAFGVSGWNGLPRIAGEASDEGSGVDRVEVSIHRVATSQWWNGASFSAASESFLTASGTTRWSLDVSAIPFANAEQYTLRWRAHDAAGNYESLGVARTFTFQIAAQTPPTSLSATSLGEARVRLTWSQPSGGEPNHYRLYYDAEGSGGPPYIGSGAAEGSAPIGVTGSLTSFDVTELPRGRYSFALSAVDANGNESALSNQASAASRWWLNTLDPLTRQTPTTLAWINSNVAIAVGTGGILWRTHDAGQTWGVVRSDAAQLNALAVSGAVVLVVGDNGTILRSVDTGLSYTVVPCPLAVSLSAVAIIGSNAVALSATGSIAYSTDAGASFAAASVTSPPISGFRSVAGDGALFVAGTAGNGLYASANGGVSWTQSTVTTGTFTAIARSGPRLVAAGFDVVSSTVRGAFATSHDGGVTFAAQILSDQQLIAVVAKGAARFVVGGDTSVRTVDLSTQPATLSDPISVAGTSISASHGLVATADAILAFNPAQVFRSTDGGDTWIGSYHGLSSLPAPMAANNSVVAIAAPGPAFLRSADAGQTFTTSVAGPQFLSTHIQAIAAGSTTLIALESDGAINRSVDAGQSWSRVRGSQSGAWTSAWGSGGEFVVVGPAISESSDNGVSWSSFGVFSTLWSNFSPYQFVGGGNCQLARVVGAGSLRVAVGYVPSPPFSSSGCIFLNTGSGWINQMGLSLAHVRNCFDVAIDGTDVLIAARMPLTNVFDALSPGPGVLIGQASMGSYHFSNAAMSAEASMRTAIAGSGSKWLASSAATNSSNIFGTGANASTSGSVGSWSTQALAGDVRSLWSSGDTFIAGGYTTTGLVQRSTTGPNGVYSSTLDPGGMTNAVVRIKGSGADVLAFGENGGFIRSEDGGATWSLQTHYWPPMLGQPTLNDGLVITPGDMSVVGNDGVILRLGPE